MEMSKGLTCYILVVTDLSLSINEGLATEHTVVHTVVPLHVWSATGPHSYLGAVRAFDGSTVRPWAVRILFGAFEARACVGWHNAMSDTCSYYTDKGHVDRAQERGVEHCRVNSSTSNLHVYGNSS